MAQGKARKRRPKGYKERHQEAIDWANSNPHIKDILAQKPSTYKPQYALDLLYAGHNGRSLVQFARDIGVSRRTLNNWSANHPDFFHAMEIAAMWRTAWYEERAQAQAAGQPGNASMTRFMLINADPSRFIELKVLEARINASPDDDAEAAKDIDFSSLPVDQRLKLLMTIKDATQKGVTIIDHEPKKDKDGA